MSIIGTRAASRFSYKRMDTDANAFATAAAITDRAQKATANLLVRQLKFSGLWTKLTVIYPFIGATPAAHKLNLKNPADSDAAFRMVFNGTWTHDANGVAPAPTTAYGDTFINPTNVIATSSKVGLCLYTHNFGNMLSASGGEFGSSNSTTQRLNLAIKAGGTYIFDCYNTTLGRIAITNSSTLGVFAIGMRTTTIAYAYYTGDMINTNLAPSQITTVVTGSSNGGSSTPTINIVLNGLNPSTLINVARTYGFAAMTVDLTAAECQNLYNIVWNVQRDLRRIN